MLFHLLYFNFHAKLIMKLMIIYSHFYFRICRRSDAGTYAVTVENSSGVVSSSVKCKVLDVPGLPQMPTKFSDVLADRLTLSWCPPLDDGGAAVSNYLVEK